MLKEILNHLLENERTMKEFREDLNFRADILKNRVDQLVVNEDIHKNHIYDLLAFKAQTKETLDRTKGKETLTDTRINNCEEGINDLNRCLSGVDPRSSIDKDELLKLLANKAERDMDDKYLIPY